ncbi:MAG TPA: hypothetical protein VN700_09300 [Vicinamibacterales bacterium]|nr:hypothetical protein [Vicinamibacterales bacterium]
MDHLFDRLGREGVGFDRLKDRLVQLRDRHAERVLACAGRAVAVADVFRHPAVLSGAFLNDQAAAAEAAVRQARQQVVGWRLRRSALQAAIRQPRGERRAFLQSLLDAPPQRFVDDAEIGCVVAQPLRLGARPLIHLARVVALA